MADLKLSDGEKLILVMLADLHTALNVKSTVNADLVREAVCSGDLWALDFEYRHQVALVPDRDPHIKTQVVDWLEMWSTMESQYEKLDPLDQMKLDKNTRAGWRFPGFDQRDEQDYLSVARFLVEKLDRFTRFKGRSIESGFSTLSRHRETYAVYEPLRPKLAEGNFSYEDMEALSVRRSGTFAG